MRVLITGGAGFIGSHLAEALSSLHEVAILDNLSTGRRENVPPDIPLYEIDLRDKEALQAHFAKHEYDVVFHLAAQADVRTSVDSPIEDAHTNVIGTLHLLDALKNKPTWLIFSSTGGAIYGEKSTFPLSESECPFPESPYGIAKLAGELYIHAFSTAYQVPYTILRLANVYGPRQNPHGEAGVIAIFSYRLLTGQPVYIYGDGEQTRDFIYVEDVVSAFLSVLGMPQRTYGQVFNVGTGVQTSVNQLYRLIAAAVGVEQEPTYLPPKVGELRRNALSAAKLHAATGWQPRYTLTEGVQRTVESFRKSLQLLNP
ncbi:MAG: NAD-dependent epimerase/dehydratase family protein [Bacteroidia bacterium]|nr:NAD-dependent epimerase/dehydratase family protein [Bacteroidia bacterium]MDW8057827.1 NAD-dependent epimerase/dehydratase family protein [Bacteroidia bacterium]